MRFLAMIILRMKFILILGFFFFLLPVFALIANEFPSFPMAFYGEATLNGELLPSNAKVRAYCGSEIIGEVILRERGVYGYDDLTKQKLLISSCAENIIFQYSLEDEESFSAGGEILNYDSGFIAGKILEKDLHFITIRSCEIEHGLAQQLWNTDGWGECLLINCDYGYKQNGNNCILVSVRRGGGGGGGGFTPEIPVTSPVTDYVGIVLGEAISLDSNDINEPSPNNINELEAEIARLTAILSSLQDQLAKIRRDSFVHCQGINFGRTLSYGVMGDDVKCLQSILNSSIDTQIASTGAGSPGQETSYFGFLTKIAVIKLQNKYRLEILMPWGLNEGNGFVGQSTIAKINDILGR